MPSAETFSIPAVSRLLDRWLLGRRVIVDPFARHSRRGTITNDLDLSCDTDCHMDAAAFLAQLAMDGVKADALLFDPPYSPRQVAECYRSIGREVGRAETQNARLYRECRDAALAVLEPWAVVVSCGWNSGGFGKERGFIQREILMVAHGGAHNDTLVTVETR